MSRLRGVAVRGAVLALLLGAGAAPAGASATPGSRGPTDVYVIGNFEAGGESARAQPNLADGADLAIAHLETQGYHITWERVPVGGTSAIAAQDAFLASAAKAPDAVIGLVSSSDFVPVGPKVAATDVPVFALAAPSEGVRSGPSGGDNIFLLRPLDAQTYARVFEYVCTDLRKQLQLEDVKIALSLVQTALGSTVKAVADREVPDHRRCAVVATVENAATASDLAQQALAIKDSDANVIVSANFPVPTGALVAQLQQNGVNLPVVGGAGLDLAVDSGAITNLDDLWVAADCVPELEKDKRAKKFVKAYTAKYGYPPNDASAQVYDAMHIIANGVKEVGHDFAELNKKFAGTEYDGVCDYTNDENNVLAQSVTVYKYKSLSDKTKVLVKKYPLELVTSEELGTPTTLPPTTAGD